MRARGRQLHNNASDPHQRRRRQALGREDPRDFQHSVHCNTLLHAAVRLKTNNLVTS